MHESTYQCNQRKLCAWLFPAEGLRGCQACKVSLHMQIRLLYCHLIVNLAEINLFINSLNVLWHVHIDHAAADI